MRCPLSSRADEHRSFKTHSKMSCIGKNARARCGSAPHKWVLAGWSSTFMRLAEKLTALCGLVHAMPAWSVKPRRAPSQQHRGASVYNLKTAAKLECVYLPYKIHTKCAHTFPPPKTATARTCPFSLRAHEQPPFPPFPSHIYSKLTNQFLTAAARPSKLDTSFTPPPPNPLPSLPYLHKTQDFLTANEGAARDYDGYDDEIRVEDLVGDSPPPDLDLDIYLEQNLGRLEVSQPCSFTLRS